MSIDTKQIIIGTRVYCGLRYSGAGTVYAIHGEQRPETIRTFGGGVGVSGGSAKVDVVFDNGSISLQLPEGIVRGIQWQIYDEVADAETIAAALAHAALVKAEKAAKAQEAAAAHAAELTRLKASADFAHLIQGDDRYSGKLAAMNIRKELKAAFPAVKFSVRKMHYGSVSVSWTDGPLDKEVEDLIGHYQGGSFNGMEDIYENSKSPWCEVFGGADYVNTRRENSPELINRAITNVFETYSGNLMDVDRPTADDFRYGRLWQIQVPGLFDNLQTLVSQQAYSLRG
ncbi:hypothetical protein R75465_07152 [Paraburkholderia aspalathi]|uniref:LPD29 domain-containing protein n=1 Tax=Paraburkholderia aspalathi TaxID=1324617 RepID=UPI001B2B7076|nr:LPD29 domain-containing protein [Paraburkholderia aspalathi]CAE6850759.1 hypothetical protein R75465_07152 [Paraburkholderia aspalathi]